MRWIEPRSEIFGLLATSLHSLEPELRDFAGSVKLLVYTQAQPYSSRHAADFIRYFYWFYYFIFSFSSQIIISRGESKIYYNMKSKDEGISPVIATILLVALTVLLVSVASIPFMNLANTEINLSQINLTGPPPVWKATPTPDSGHKGAIQEFLDSINASYPDAVKPFYGNGDKLTGFELVGDLVIAGEPLVITTAIMDEAGTTFDIKTTSGAIIKRASGRSDSPLLVFEASGGLHVIAGSLILDGMGEASGAPLLEIKPGAKFELNGELILKNNVNSYGSMPGGGLCNNGTIILKGGSGVIDISNNIAPLGGGIYNTGILELNSNKISITQNTAQKGGGIYNAGGKVTLTTVKEIKANSATDGSGSGSGNSYYAVSGSTTSGISGLLSAGADQYRDSDI